MLHYTDNYTNRFVSRYYIKSKKISITCILYYFRSLLQSLFDSAIDGIQVNF